MGKARDKAWKNGKGGRPGGKAKDGSDKPWLKKEQQRGSSCFRSDADDREFEAQVEKIGCKIKYIMGDGNCLFRSLADQVEGVSDDHAAVRAKIMNHLEVNREVFEPYMEDDESFGDYLARMRGDAEWGGNQELVAASQLYKANIVVHQFRAPRFIIPLESAKLTIHLSYHGEHHYNSVRAIGDEGDGPALPVTLETPSPGHRKDGSKSEGTCSPWPDQEKAIARTCPWASWSSIVQALESTGGRGEDAIELLIAAQNDAARVDGTEVDDKCTSSGPTTPSGGHSTREGSTSGPAGDSSPGNTGSGEDRMVGNSGVGLVNAASIKDGKPKLLSKSAKAAKKATRAADCPCGSGVKYKRCCRKKDAALARGQLARPDPERAKAAPAEDSSIAHDLGSLVI